MTGGSDVPRRAVLIGISGLAASAAFAVRAQDARGFGGTGAAAPLPTGDDRGIGGTGVIGTIRRFGSIVVNDLRIAFPRSVDVTIDERPASRKDLKIGHVVQVMAQRRAGRLTTGLIAAESQVVGPIESTTGGRMVVLGQEVELPPDGPGGPWRLGDVVAVSGLRRLDGVVVASLVESRPAAGMRVAGLLRIENDGTLRIGALVLTGLPETLAGHGVTVVGRLDRGLFRAERMLADPLTRFGGTPSRLSVEAYAAEDRGRLRLGSGASIAAASAVALALDPDAPSRVVISASLSSGGDYRVQSLRVETESRKREGGGKRGPARGTSGAPETGAAPFGTSRGVPPSAGPRPSGHGDLGGAGPTGPGGRARP